MLLRRVAPLLALTVLFGGCSQGTVEGDLFVTMSRSNVSFFEDVIYPRQDATDWREAFGSREDTAMLRVPYSAHMARAMITQSDDLQLTSHYTMNRVFRDAALGDALGYLEDQGARDELTAQLDDRFDDLAGWQEDREDDWSAPSDPSWARYFDTGLNEQPTLQDLVLSQDGPGYGQVNDDLRLIMLINLPSAADTVDPACADAGSFSSSDWSYPHAIRANFAETIDVDGDFPIPVCEVQLMARLELGQNTYDATSDSIILIEELTLPDEGGTPRIRGQYLLSFSAQDFSQLDGNAVASGSFDIRVTNDPWEIDEPERQQDIGDDSFNGE